MARVAHLDLDRRVIRGEIADVLVLQIARRERHRLVPSRAAAIILERLDEIDLDLPGEMRRVRQLRDAVEPVARLALQRLLPAGFRVAGGGRCDGESRRAYADGRDGYPQK